MGRLGQSLYWLAIPAHIDPKYKFLYDLGAHCFLGPEAVGLGVEFTYVPESSSRSKNISNKQAESRKYLKIETVCSLEKSINFYQTIQRHT
jgi:hypothetical protein